MTDYWQDVIHQWPAIVAQVVRIGVPPQFAEDVAAEALRRHYETVQRNGNVYAVPGEFWRYHWRTVRSTAIDYLRYRYRPADRIEAHVISTPPPAEPFDPPAQVRDTLAALPDDQRYALAFIIDRVPPREMARMTGWSMQACHNVRRATWLKLRRAYAAAGEVHELAISRKKGARKPVKREAV